MSASKQRKSLEGSSKAHTRSSSGQYPFLKPLSIQKPRLDVATRQDDQDHFILPNKRWEAAVGNLEEARVTFDVLARAVEDAVYLDEDAYKEVAPIMQFTKVVRAQQRKIEHLEGELREAKSKMEESESVRLEALRRHADMQQEIENNAVVFQMHYQELLSKDDEINKLTAVIEALSGN